jgi:cation diffusion facilitator CzcD-associated flavoprotein CzcO
VSRAPKTDNGYPITIIVHSGCDVPTHLYSFSFNLNPDWSRELCDQKEILEYMDATVDKFKLRHHVHTSVECLGAEWDADKVLWKVKFLDLETKVEFTRTATIFVSAVGGISFPRDVKFEGMETFKGKMFHTARWDHSVRWANKRIAVIGNGCSAAQVLPPLAKKASFVKQYARSAQWYHDRPNREFSIFEKFAFKYIPLWMRLLRLRIFLDNDASTATYMDSPGGVKARLQAEEEAKKYIYRKTPKKYHDIIVPTFQLGCKRRIFDPEYLDALHQPNVELVAEGISAITEDGIISSKSLKKDNFDIIVLATGFQVSQFLTPMEVFGKSGKSLNQQWVECRGAQAYMGTYVHNFPNMAIM